MGRRQKAAKIEEMIPTSERANPLPPRAETRHVISNPSFEQAKPNPEIGESSLERGGFQPKMWKKAKKHTAGVRRSKRIQNSHTPAPNSDIDLLVEEIILSESEKEDEQQHIHNEKELEEQPIMSDKSLKENVSYLVQLMEEQKNSIEALNSKVHRNSFQSGEGPSATDVKYKSMYIDSQKKIELLEKENNKLQNQLELTASKLEGYEKGTRGLTEMFDKLKDVIVVSNLARATDKAVNVSQICGVVTNPDADHEPGISGSKRKRLKKG